MPSGRHRLPLEAGGCLGDKSGCERGPFGGFQPGRLSTGRIPRRVIEARQRLEDIVDGLAQVHAALDAETSATGTEPGDGQLTPELESAYDDLREAFLSFLEEASVELPGKLALRIDEDEDE